MARSRRTVRKTYKRQQVPKKFGKGTKDKLILVEKTVDSNPSPVSEVVTKSGGVSGLTGRQAKSIANAKTNAKKTKYRQASAAVASSAASAASSVHDTNQARIREAEEMRKMRESEANAAVKIAEYKYGKTSDSSLKPEEAKSPELLPNGTTEDPSEQNKQSDNPPWALTFD